MSMSVFDRAGGDRVETATIAVLARSDLAVVREVLADAGGLGDALLGPRVVPATAGSAARVTAYVDWSFEVVTRPGAFDHEGPVRDRLRRIAVAVAPDGWLFVLTPDPPVPSWLAAPDGVPEEAHGRIVWISFAWFATAVRDALADPTRVVDPRSQVLMAELLALYDGEGLLETGPTDTAVTDLVTQADDTLVVDGADAWSDFLDHAAYVMPAGRTMPPGVLHLGFHRRGRIMAVVPRVLDCLTGVELTERGAAALRDAGRPEAAGVVTSLARGERYAGEVRTVLALSPAGDPATARLPGPVDDPGPAPPRLTRLDALTQ